MLRRDWRPFSLVTENRLETDGSIKASIPTAYSTTSKCASTGERRRAALLQSPLPDSNRRPPPYHGGFYGSRACTRDHARQGFPANQSDLAAEDMSRDVARVVSDVSVSCPRAVDVEDNRPGSLSQRIPLAEHAMITSGVVPQLLRFQPLPSRFASPVHPCATRRTHARTSTDEDARAGRDGRGCRRRAASARGPGHAVQSAGDDTRPRPPARRRHTAESGISSEPGLTRPTTRLDRPQCRWEARRRIRREGDESLRVGSAATGRRTTACARWGRAMPAPSLLD
jgi:hypothetical protein